MDKQEKKIKKKRKIGGLAIPKALFCLGGVILLTALVFMVFPDGKAISLENPTASVTGDNVNVGFTVSGAPEDGAEVKLIMVKKTEATDLEPPVGNEIMFDMIAVDLQMASNGENWFELPMDPSLRSATLRICIVGNDETNPIFVDVDNTIIEDKTGEECNATDNMDTISLQATIEPPQGTITPPPVTITPPKLEVGITFTTTSGGTLTREMVNAQIAAVEMGVNDTFSAYFGSNVTSIGYEAFYSRTNLTYVVIPASVTNIGDDAFSSCINLHSAYFYGRPPSTFGSNVFANTSSYFTIFYSHDQAGWTTPTWNGYRTESFIDPIQYSLKGLIRSNNPNNPTTIQLMRGDEEVQRITIAPESGIGQRDQDFGFKDVVPGIYSLVVSKKAHTKFTVQNIAVTKNILVDLTQNEDPDVRLVTLRCGDINGDGMINDGDLTILWQLANYNRDAKDAGNPDCDLNGDGMINDGDLTILWQVMNYNRNEVIVVLPVGATEPSVATLDVLSGQNYYVTIKAQGVSEICEISVVYDSSVLRLVNPAAFQSPNDAIKVGPIPGTDIEVLSHQNGELRLICNKYIPDGMEWNGVVTLLEFGAIASGETQLQLSIDATGDAVSKIHTVSFDTTGGSAIPPMYARHDTLISAPAEPTRADESVSTFLGPGIAKYIFGGWWKDAQFKNYWDFSTDRVTEDITLYALWSQMITVDPHIIG